MTKRREAVPPETFWGPVLDWCGRASGWRVSVATLPGEDGEAPVGGVEIVIPQGDGSAWRVALYPEALVLQREGLRPGASVRLEVRGRVGEDESMPRWTVQGWAPEGVAEEVAGLLPPGPRRVFVDVKP